jgi:hypothetical protein
MRIFFCIGVSATSPTAGGFGGVALIEKNLFGRMEVQNDDIVLEAESRAGIILSTQLAEMSGNSMSVISYFAV